MKLFFVFPLSGPNNGVKVISNHIKNGVFSNGKLIIHPIDTAQAKDFNNFGKFNLKKIITFFKLIKQLLIVKSSDYIYLNLTPKGYAFYRDLIILALCKVKTRHITGHIHANGLENNIKWYNKFLFNSIKIIVINQHQKKKLRDFCPNIFLIPNVLPDYFKNKKINFKKNEKINFIFLSNISKEKGLNRIIEIADMVFLERIKCNINVYGGALTDVEKRKIESLAAKYDFVNYYGPIINEEEKFISLLNNDVLLFLSDENYEVYPLVYIEALMSGLSIITTNQIVSKNFQKLGIAKILNNDLSNFINIIDDFISFSRDKNIKVKARNVYLEKYSFDNYIERIEEVILYDTISN